MSRSVSYLDNAELVVYIDPGDELDDDIGWDDFVDSLSCVLTAWFPSLYESDRWDGQETRIILENSFAEIGISEYCGLVSLSIRAKADEYEYSDRLEELGKQWIANIEKKFLSLGNLSKIGTASNGESFYEKVGEASYV